MLHDDDIWVPKNPDSIGKADGVDFSIALKPKRGNDGISTVNTDSGFREDGYV